MESTILSTYIKNSSNKIKSTSFIKDGTASVISFEFAFSSGNRFMINKDVIFCFSGFWSIEPVSHFHRRIFEDIFDDSIFSAMEGDDGKSTISFQML